MWTNITGDYEFLIELSNDIVAEVAPEELPLFDDLVHEYFDDPTPPDLSATGSDDPLGFGLGETLVAVTPAATAVVSAVLTYIITDVLRTFQEESAEVLKKKIKGLFRKDSAGQSPLTTQQLEQIRKLAIRKAREFGIESRQSRQMADVLISSLALSK